MTPIALATADRATVDRLPAGIDPDAEFARIVDELTRRGFLGGGLGAAGLVGLAACGSPGSDGAHSSSSTPTTREVQGAYGPVELPTSPKRVVALSKAAVNTMLDLGITPVGVDEGEADVALPQYVAKVKTIPTVGTYGQFSIEKIAALKPDLLLSYDTYIDEKLYAKVKALVPTFALKTDEGNIAWQDSTAGFANAVNRPNELAAWKKRYDDRLTQVKTTYHDQLADNRWEMVQSANPGFYRYLPSADALTVLSQLGATLGNAGAHNANYYGDPISLENIQAKLGHATVIIGIANGIEAVTSSPLWKRLPAVTAGHAYFSNDLFPGGYSGGIALLDFLADVCDRLAAK